MPATFLAQIDALLKEAERGGTLGGQALLFLVAIVLVYAVVKMYNSGKDATAKILEAADRQRNEDRIHHESLVDAYRMEREKYQIERGENFQTLLRIAGESARALEATAASINAQVAATNSLRETMHTIRNDMQANQNERDLRKV